MRILFISPYIPTPIRTRPYNFIRALARRGHEITLLALRAPGDPAAPPDEIVRACWRWEALPLPRERILWNILWALPRDYPLQAAYSHSPQMVRLIRQVVAESDGGGRAAVDHPSPAIRRPSSFDVVHIEHLRGVALGAAVEGVPKVYDAVDCISLLFERARRQAPSWRHRLMAGIDLGRTRRFEGRIVGEMDGVLVSSPEDRDALAKLCPPQFAPRIHLLPNGVDLEYFDPNGSWSNEQGSGSISPAPPLSCSPAVVFSGKMSYHANVAAALDLALTIMPRVWEACPDVHLTIAGKDPPASLKALERDPRIHVTGTLPDLRLVLAGAAVVACPLRYGAGIQNKVLEAMALARPVVASPQAMAALNAVPGRDLLLGNDPAGFAQQVIRLLNDPDLRRTIGQAGRRYVEEHHRWDDLAGRLEQIYRSALNRPRGLS